MKKYIYSFAAALLAVAGGCSKDTEGTTWITFYPQMTVSGPTYINWEAGKAFQEPGVTIIMNDEDVTDQMVVTTSLDFANPAPGFYTIEYGFTNPDGIVAKSTRYVSVYSPSAPEQGYYATGADSNRSGEMFATGKFFPIMVKAVDGGYSVNDLLGGYYALGRGYGANYALAGVVSVAADGTVSLEKHTLCPGWPTTPLESFEDASFDAATSTFHWVVGYAGTPFDVYLTKL